MRERHTGLYLGTDRALATGRHVSSDAQPSGRLAPGIMERFAEKLSGFGFTDKTVLPPLEAFIEQILRVKGVMALGLTYKDRNVHPLLEAFILHDSEDHPNRAYNKESKIYDQAALALEPMLDLIVSHTYPSVYRDADALRFAVDHYTGDGIHSLGVVDQSSLPPIRVKQDRINRTPEVFLRVFGQQG